MFKLHVAGRGLIKPTTTTTVSEDGVHIHIDDDARPEFWVAVSIDLHTLADIAAQVAAAAAANVEGK